MDEYDSEYFEYSTDCHSEKNDDRGSYLNGHLSSPITLDDCFFLLKYKQFFCKRHILLKERITELNITKTIYECCKDPYICIQKYINDEPINVEKKTYLKILEVSKRGYEIHLLNFLENSITLFQRFETTNRISQIYDLLRADTNLFHHFSIMKKVESIKDNICLSKIKFGELIVRRNLEVERDIFLFTCPEHGVCIGPTNLLICALDIYQSRFTLLLYFKLSDIQNKYPSSIYDVGLSLISQFEHLRRIMGNSFYSFISNWESMIIGYTINDDTNDLGFDKLFHATLAKAEELLNSHNISFPNILLPAQRTKDNIKVYRINRSYQTLWTPFT